MHTQLLMYGKRAKNYSSIVEKVNYKLLLTTDKFTKQTALYDVAVVVPEGWENICIALPLNLCGEWRINVKN